MQTEDAGDNNKSERQEGAGDNDDSILDSLSQFLDDVSPMASEEYERYYKELEDAEKEDGESSPPKQVFATLASIDDDEDDDPEKAPSRAKIPAPAQPEAPPRVYTRQTPEPSQGQSLKFYEGMASDMLVQIGGRRGEHIQQKEILTTPITPEVTADVEALEAKRKQLLAESENIVKITTSVLEDKLEIDGLYEQAVENGRLAEEEYVKARELAEECKNTVKEAHEEARQM
jgi:hypothetical protein